MGNTLYAILIFIVLGKSSSAQGETERDLDAFMSKVLEKREVNWEALHGYVFSETETLAIKGINLPPTFNFKREYVWIVRDGYLLRSPVRVNNVKVSKEEQAAEEEEWVRKRKDKRHDSLERDAFFDFKFEPGSYLYAGKKMFQGREVVAIECYPSKKSQARGSDKKDDEDEYERMFEKTILVTLLVEPKEHQIVHITFDNVGMDFLPYRWLVPGRAPGVHDHGQAFGRCMVAQIDYGGGKPADSEHHPFSQVHPGVLRLRKDRCARQTALRRTGFERAQEMKKRRTLALLCLLLWRVPAAPGGERIIVVRFHGNYSISDDEMARLADVRPGAVLDEASLAEIKNRLVRTRKFEWVEVSKRYRSLSADDEVVLVITVKEKPPARSKFMFMPILSGSDEYGFTYGGRFTSIDLLGAKERLSLPVTWGGIRRAALEASGIFTIPSSVPFTPAQVSREKKTRILRSET